MPFYFRKSISAGPFRINLSKSGIGVSVGVQGLRIGSGPKGNYLHAGTGGVYYRTSLNSKREAAQPLSAGDEVRGRSWHFGLGCVIAAVVVGWLLSAGSSLIQTDSRHPGPSTGGSSDEQSHNQTRRYAAKEIGSTSASRVNEVGSAAGPREATPSRRTMSAPVALAVSVEGNRKPIVVGHTNLPEGTRLIVDLRQRTGPFSAREIVAVNSGGQFRAGPFLQQGGRLKDGVYVVEITSQPMSFQSLAVRSIVGHRGEHLRGPFTVAIGEGRGISWRQNAVLNEQVQANVRSASDRSSRLQQACKKQCGGTKNGYPSAGSAWSQCYLECLADNDDWKPQR